MSKSDVNACFNKQNFYSFLICFGIGIFGSWFGWQIPLMAGLVFVVFAIIRFFYLEYNKDE